MEGFWEYHKLIIVFIIVLVVSLFGLIWLQAIHKEKKNEAMYQYYVQNIATSNVMTKKQFMDRVKYNRHVSGQEKSTTVVPMYIPIHY
jgi:ABC-type transporter Mla subunit MlaD